MDETIRLIQRYVAEEYEVMIQLRTESDTSLIESNLDSLNRFFQDLDSDLYLSSSRRLEEREAVVGQYQPRVVYKIEQYAHPTYSSVCRVLLGAPFQGDDRCFSSFYVAETEEGPRIVARYNLCSYCNGEGREAKHRCSECHGLGWNWRGGLKIEPLGEIVDAREFVNLS